MMRGVIGIFGDGDILEKLSPPQCDITGMW
jgi:hypothetical protein